MELRNRIEDNGSNVSVSHFRRIGGVRINACTNFDHDRQRERDHVGAILRAYRVVIEPISVSAISSGACISDAGARQKMGLLGRAPITA